MKKFLVVAILSAVAIFLIGYFFKAEIFQLAFKPTKQNEPIGLSAMQVIDDIEVVAEGLKIPWDLVFLPDGHILVTERVGNLKRIGDEIIDIPLSAAKHAGEGGLLGIALHPDFVNNNFLYLYLTAQSDEGLINRVERYRFINNELKDREIIIDNIPGAKYHDGGKIVFGPDNLLYITTGDAGQENLAQDLNSVAGKVLRLNDDGSVPADNPFRTKVYSYGHRNSQSLTWDVQGRLWSTEHGRSGIKSGLDELNLIEPGRNYGWPQIEGDEVQDQMESPAIQSGPDITWAPAGAAYLNGSIFFGGLRGESLYQASATGEVLAHFQGEYGRIRAVVVGPDGFLYITTSNTDGRGRVQDGDDKIIKINPDIFK